MADKKNIFLTGKRHVGKSTIIDRVMEAMSYVKFGGLRTKPLFDDMGELVAFYLSSVSGTEDPKIFAKKQKNGKWTAVAESFDEYGTYLLEKSLKDDTDIIVIDELGFFEAKAFHFQKAVIKCLSSPKTVLGVMKPLPVPFLNEIRKRDDVYLAEITLENRDHKLWEIKKKIEEVQLKCSTGLRKV